MAIRMTKRPVSFSSRMSCLTWRDEEITGPRRGWRMVASDSFAEFLREQLAPLGRVTTRRMFGKTGVFCDGFMLAMVVENTLYFRVDNHNQTAFAEAATFPPLNYEKGGQLFDLSFWRAP